MGLGDDQHPVGYEAAFDPWLKEVWGVLRRECPLPGAGAWAEAGALTDPPAGSHTASSLVAFSVLVVCRPYTVTASSSHGVPFPADPERAPTLGEGARAGESAGASACMRALLRTSGQTLPAG